MSYSIRSEDQNEPSTIAYWRGEHEPDLWVYHPADAAKFTSPTAARAAYKRGVGETTAATTRHGHYRLYIVGGPDAPAT